MIRRLVRSTDFERVLRTRTRINSTHFAVHHVADHPGVPLVCVAATGKAVRPPTHSTDTPAAPAELSTGMAARASPPVDDFTAPADIWLGAVVPKRHARRSVTRTLLKRQIRAVVSAHIDALAGGLWVIRLRAPFDRAVFSSAASDALKCVARDELDQLLVSAARRAGRA